MKTRRQALRMFGGTAALIGLPGLTFAAAPPEPRANDRRLVFMFLRGGMDGLSAVAPFGDSQYAVQRGPLAVPAPGTPGGALNLDGHFGLSPHLAEMHKLFAARELTVLHAVASPYRERSHFDAQNLLENGMIKPFGRETGWLNVALGTAERAGGGTQPRHLGFRPRTEHTARAARPGADRLLVTLQAAGARCRSARRLAALYRDDVLLGPSFAVAREAQSHDGRP